MERKKKYPKVRLTITPEQEMVIRENWGKVQRMELRKMLGITRGKLDANLNRMKDLPVREYSNKKRQEGFKEGMFNVNTLSNWLIGNED